MSGLVAALSLSKARRTGLHILPTTRDNPGLEDAAAAAAPAPAVAPTPREFRIMPLPPLCVAAKHTDRSGVPSLGLAPAAAVATGAVCFICALLSL